MLERKFAHTESRDKTIIRTSVVGILANAFLSGFKAVIGLMTNSIAIVLDAVNNLSDAAASLITIIGTKLAGRQGPFRLACEFWRRCPPRRCHLDIDFSEI